MRLQDIMTKTVQTVPSDLSVRDALDRMRRNKIHHLVVRDGGPITGVVSEHDLASCRPGDRVGSVMSTKVATLSPDATVRQAANVLRGRGIGCIPLLDGDERLVGIVTTSDLLTLLGKGAEKPVATRTRWTLKGREPRRRAFVARS